MAVAQVSDDSELHEVVEPAPSPIQGFHLKEEMLRDHLVLATQHQDREALERALHAYRSHGLPSDCKAMAEACRKLDILTTKDEIKKATQLKDLPTLKQYLKAIRDQEEQLKQMAEQNGTIYNREDGISFHMEREIQEAKKVLRDSFARDRRKVLDMPETLALDRNAMSEVRSYQKPPKGVHNIMQATYLLLGEDEYTTMEWLVCAKMANPLGPSGLQKRLMKFDFKKCNEELVARSKQILSGIQLEDIVNASRGGACFYVYANGVIDEYEKIKSVENVTPAKIDRQREILHREKLDPKLQEKQKRAKALSRERHPILVEPKY